MSPSILNEEGAGPDCPTKLGLVTVLGGTDAESVLLEATEDTLGVLDNAGRLGLGTNGPEVTEAILGLVVRVGDPSAVRAEGFVLFVGLTLVVVEEGAGVVEEVPFCTSSAELTFVSLLPGISSVGEVLLEYLDALASTMSVDAILVSLEVPGTSSEEGALASFVVVRLESFSDTTLVSLVPTIVYLLSSLGLLLCRLVALPSLVNLRLFFLAFLLWATPLWSCVRRKPLISSSSGPASIACSTSTCIKC